MTAATDAPARYRTQRARGGVPLTAARLLRIELRRSTMPLILPVIAALFWFDSYRFGTGTPPFWVLRTFWNMGQGRSFMDFAPFVAGVAAWTGSRDGRRRTADLVTGAVWPRWAAQLAAWAATAIWAVGAYLAFVGVMFAVYAYQGLLGSPPWWWVAVGVAVVTAFCAAGFAVGALFPSRFAAPAAAFGAFLLAIVSLQNGFGDTSGWPLILPGNANGNYQPVSGIFYPYLPDLPIARVMFLAGIAVAVLGLLGLPGRAGGARLRAAAAMITLAGVAAAGTASVLVRTARLTPHGMVIPALHDAASDRPIGYAPVCDQAAGVPVCLNPAYRRYLPEVTADLRPVLAEVAGLPGAPTRAAQVAGRYMSGMFEDQNGVAVTISGHPPVLRLPLDEFNTLPSATPGSAEQFDQEMLLLPVHAFVVRGNGGGTPAQQAVQAALWQQAGIPFAAQPDVLTIFGLPAWAGPALQGLVGNSQSTNGPGPPHGPVYAAARRFAALPAAARHAWLAAHLAALRAGRTTLAQLP
ncbi:MAG TPA: hypothetical protein VMC03_21430 [Streptosporangiaceae bacterium]|nr:hypothetical protein [Streptosporangiaceae bacterium]